MLPMATRNFYYGREAGIVSGSANFAALIGADAESYGLTENQSSQYVLLDAALQEAYLASVTPETRTPVAVARKDICRRDVQIRAALLAKIIYATATVSDAQLTALGLRPRAVPSARPAAMTPPVVTVRSVIGRVVTVRIDAAAADGARRPIGSAGAHVYSFAGPEAPTDARQYEYVGLATRATYEVRFANDVASGATVWIAAAWVSQRGVAGAACTPVQVTIQGGPVLAMAA